MSDSPTTPSRAGAIAGICAGIALGLLIALLLPARGNSNAAIGQLVDALCRQNSPTVAIAAVAITSAALILAAAIIPATVAYVVCRAFERKEHDHRT